MRDLLLYIITVLIWGSTWLAITFQLGRVDPMVSVIYRFALAAVVMFGICLASGRRLRFNLKVHGRMALFGTLLFSVNYWLVYQAEIHLTSGLVAVVFSTLIFMNAVNGRIVMGTPIHGRVITGAAIGLTGVALIFWPEITAVEVSSATMAGLALSMASVYLASLGNVASAYLQREGLPVLQSNAFGMAYGALVMFAVAVTCDRSFAFDPSPAYVVSLLYLALFGSVIAFWTYLTLLGRIGADRAAYAIMLVPGVALLFSTFFEGYQWTPAAAFGLVMVMAGNLLLLKKPGRGSAAAKIPDSQANGGAMSDRMG
jgi:drug/metabolite transporter (DMT)-like permease